MRAWRTVLCATCVAFVAHTTVAFAQHHHHGGGDATAPNPAPNPPNGGTGAAGTGGVNDPSGLDQAARILFESARTAFNAGDYPTALQRFEQAYSASPRPLLLYNIATTLDRLRRDDDALAKFQEFLAAVPDTPNRAEIEGRIRALQQVVDQRHQQEEAARQQQEAAQHAADEAARRQAEEDARRQQEADQHHDQGGAPAPSGGGLPLPVFIATAGVGGAALIGGIITGVLTLGANDDYVKYTMTPGATRAGAQPYFDNANTLQLVTNVLLFGGAAVAIAAGVLAIFTDWGGGGGAEHAPAAGTTTPTASFDAHHFVLGSTTYF